MSASGSPPSGADAPLTADNANHTDPTSLEPSKGKGRNRICKTCKFSCTNAREFSNHQRSAHGEGKEEEESLAPVPVSRRSSLRQKRASVSAANGGAGPSPAADDVGTNDGASTSHQVNTNGPAASNTSKGAGTALQVNTDEPAASSDGKATGTSLLVDINRPTAGTESCDASTNVQTSSRTTGSTSTNLQTKYSTGPTDFNGNPTHTQSEDAMIATSTPTAPHAPSDYLNMSSSFSEDEIDLSEEGGRLVIDDSSAANGSSAVTPTRCGNIQNRTYVCSVCEFTSTAAKAYLRHQRDVHNYEIAIYECDICDYATKYKQKLPRHRKLHFSGTDFLMDPGQASDSTDGPTSTAAPMLAPQLTTTTAATSGTPATPIMNGAGPETPNGDTLAIIPSISAGIRESLPPVIVDDEEDEEEDNGSKLSDSPVPEIMEIPDREPEEKKKKRQEVDPAKYFEVVEEAGTKFACSSCGNSYKWRKSLNKHWKEKHNGETPDNSRFPAGMRSVVQSGHHTPGGRRRLYHNQLLQKITVNQDEEISGIIEDGASNGSASSSRPETPQNFLNGSYNGGVSHTSGVDGGHFLPSVIGPFITGQPVFPGAEQFKSLTASLNGPIPSQSALDLSRHSSPMDETDSIHHSGMQSEPLDLAIRRDDQPSPVNLTSIKTEQPWDESPEDVPEMDTSALDGDSSDGNVASNDNPHHKNNILKCKKCPFVAKTVVDYSAHMTLHLNKKAYKCAACQKHFEQLSLLNEHFASQHADLITSHKEAIQRIPHGLQQTYHLLKMPLTSIPNLSTQDLGKPDEKQLKCNMCDFVAKWPAELQKHAVSHSEERPFMCMVCGSTYKWKWDMVKHFEKAHQSLSNPYKRREPGTPLNSVLREGASHSNPAHDSDSVEFDDMDLPPTKRPRCDSNSSMPDLSDYAQPGATFSQDDSSVAGILAITQAANRMVSRQPNFLDDGPDDLHGSMSSDPMDLVHQDSDSLGIQIAHVRSLHQAVEEERRDQDGDDPSRPINVKTQRAVANVVRSRQNGPPKPHQTKPYSRPVPTEPSQLPYKCVQCEYRARWPSEITQHMKNHSNEKPYRCPLCTYRSKWKWDVVKHMRRCGTHPDGSPLTIKDVIDTTVQKKPRQAPPNAMVMPEGGVEPINPKPLPLASVPAPSGIAFLVNTTNPEGQATPTVVLPSLPASSTPGVSPASVTAALNSVAASLTLAQFQQSQAAAAAAAAIARSSDSSSPSGQQGQNSTPKFRSLINGDKYVCLECPFVGNSPAELKRHQMLHSENKPFMCRACGYSSRWKCDLKKHQKVYNHYTNDDQEDSSDKDQPPFTCKTCSLGFPNTHMLATHEKKHTETGSNGMASSRFGCKKCDFSANDLASLITHRKSQHPQNVAATARTSPTPGATDTSKTEEQDEARLKHPRKPMKKFCCSMCDFVCTSRGLLQVHEEEHEREGYCCFYCSNHYQTKDKLLDHISSHPEFNPNEWETFFIEDDDEEDDDDDTEDVNNNSNVGKMGEAKPTMSSGTLANTIDLTKSGTSPPPPLVPVSQLTAATHQANTRRFECEWCSATFAHITTLYQHARNLHPLQLRDQEVAEMSPSNSTQGLPKPHSISFASFNARAVNLNMSSSSNSTVIPSPIAGTALQNSTPLQKAVASLQQRANGQLSSIATSLATKGGLAFFPTTSLVTDLTDAKGVGQVHNEGGNVVAACTTTTTLISDTKTGDAPINLTTTKQVPQFQCVKCPYVGSTAQAYLRHIEQHSVQAPHACLFCDFSTDRVNKAYLHMRSSHPLEWSRLGQQSEQHMLGLIAKESLRHALQPNTEDTQDVVSAIPVTTMALVNKDLLLQQQLPQSLPITKDLLQQQMQASLSTVSSPLLPSAQNPLAPLYRKRRSPSYQGIPVQQLMADGRRIYQCLLCQFISANVASVAAHTRDAHGPQGKYQCCYCNFSVDNLKLIQHHQETAHPNQRIAIDVLYLEELSPHVHAPTSIVNMHKLVKMTTQQQDISKPPILIPKREPIDEISKPEKMLRCLQCPFMVPTADRLRQHMRCHNNNGKYQCRECDFSTNEPALLLEHAQVHEPGYTGSLASGITMALHSLQSAVMNNPPHSRSVDRDNQPAISTPRNSKETGQPGALDLSIEVTAHDQALNQQAKTLSQKIRATGGGSGRIRYCCSECPYHTFCRNNIVKHRRQHLIKNRFQCGVCSYSASRAFLLQQHERFHQEALAGSADTSATKHYQDLILDPFDPTVESSFTGDDDLDDQEDEDIEMEIEAECDDNGQSGLTAPTADWPPLSRSSIEKGAAVHAADTEAKEIMEAEEADTSGKCTPSADNTASLAEKQFRTYKCQQCPFSSNSPFEFRKHTNFHGMQNRYKCDRCTYSLDRLNLLTQHRKLHSDEPDFDPNPPTSMLLNHEAILRPLSASEAESMRVPLDDDDHHPSPNPSPAPSTPTPTPTVSKTESAPAEDLLICPSCPYKTPKQKAFSIHSSMHGLRRKYICDFCDWSADRLSLLYQHRRVHLTDPNFDPTPIDSIFLNHEFTEDVPGEFEAKILDIDAAKDGLESQSSGNTDSAPSLSPPFKLSITKKMYSCEHCPYVTGNRPSFDYHLSMHGSAGCYTCDSCSYSTERWSLLRQHVRLHNADQKDKCDKVQTARDAQKSDTVDRSDMEVSKDSTDKDAAKGENEKVMVDSADLYVSVKNRKHADSASDLQCQRCPFSATSKHDLIQHVQQHAGHGTMACPYCDFTGADQAALLPHVQIHFTAPLDLDNLRELLTQPKKDATPTPASKEKSVVPAQTDMDSNTDKSEKVGNSSAVSCNLSVDHDTEAAKNDDPKKEHSSGGSATDSGGSTGQKEGEGAAPQNAVSQKTKVYVCQYCEREFEAKGQMIQHERQHVV